MDVSMEAGHLLVVDDDKMNRLMLVRCLTQAGHTVDTAEDGVQALEKLCQRPYDVILLDCEMPNMDGYETLERIMAAPDLRAIPVIMISGNADAHLTAKFIARGATDYLPKPWNPDVLRARLQNSLETKRSS